MDPRLNIIDKRLEKIKKIIAISGAKGGIGKSSVASTLALTLSKFGYKVGLLDLDFTCPSTHIILDIKGLYPKENKGIIPPKIHNIKFMSIIYYAGDNPLPLRGIGISNTIIEFLAIVRWGSLDFLIIDMPPGIGDVTLDTIRLMKKIEFLVITTQSKITLETVKKLLKILKELEIPIIGVVENIRFPEVSPIKKQIESLNVPILGEIRFDKDFEDSVGDINKLAKTKFMYDIKEIVLRASGFKLKNK